MITASLMHNFKTVYFHPVLSAESDTSKARSWEEKNLKQKATHPIMRL
jgi:hypothetical protein